MPAIRLRCTPSRRKNAYMASKSARSDPPKRNKSGTRVLGRSAVTGRFILTPASKGSSRAIQKTRTAVKSLHSEKKK